MDISNWVSSLANYDSRRKLRDVLFPGTHNAYCDSINIRKVLIKRSKWFTIASKIPCMTSSLVKRWTLNQSTSMFTQMKNGVRFLDLDVTIDDNENFRLVHSFDCGPFDRALEDIFNFLITSNEIVLINVVERVMTYEQKKILHNMILQRLGRFINETSFYSLQDETLSSIIESNKRLIVFGSFFNNSNIVNGEWLDTNSYSAFYKKMTDILSQTPPDQFLSLQWIFTPKTKDIVKGIFSSSSIKSKSKKFNKSISNMGSDQFKHVNIIQLDFPNNSLIEYIVKINYD